MIRWRWQVLVALLFCASTGLARVIDPPANELKSKWTTLVTGVVADSGTPDQILLTDVQSLSVRQAASTELTLRAPAWVVSSLINGDRVIAAYLIARRDPTLTDRRILDPKGPRLLMSGGLEPALFRDNATTRERLFDSEGMVRVPGLSEALSGLGDPDPQWQNYYASELAIRPQLRMAVDAKALQVVESALRNADLHPSARAALFRAVPQFPARDTKWWHAAANDALQTLPTALSVSISDTRADLVRTVLDLFATQAVAPAEASVERWVTCGLPALVESALLVTRQFQPEREAVLIEQALAQTLLPSTTRAFLIDHDRRLTIMREALARRDGQ